MLQPVEQAKKAKKKHCILKNAHCRETMPTQGKKGGKNGDVYGENTTITGRKKVNYIVILTAYYDFLLSFQVILQRILHLHLM